MATSMKFVGKIRHVFGIAMPSNHNVGQDVDKIIIPILRIGMPVLVAHISPDTGGFWISVTNSSGLPRPVTRAHSPRP